MTNDLQSTMPTALFVAYGGGHIGSLLPVAAVLRDSGWRVHVLALTTAFKYAKAQGWEPLGFKDFLTPADDPALLFADSLVGNDATDLVPLEESRAYLGLSYLDLVGERGEEDAARAYAQKGRQAFLPVATMRRILKRLRPDVLITTASPRAEYAAQLAADELGIKRVILLDLPDAYMVDRVASVAAGACVCVADRLSREMLLQRGVDDAYIRVAGNPAFDSLHAVSQQAITDYRAKAGVAEDGALVVWASQPEPTMHPATGEVGNPDLPAEIETALRQWASGREKDRLVVRYHPSEARDFYVSPNTGFSSRADDLSVLLNACDALVTMTSTVAIQAAALGKRVVSVDLSVFSRDLPLVELGISRGVTSLDSLPMVLESVLEEARVPGDSVADSGRAADFVADVIKNMFV
ncbi:UDP-N-acetyl glucosamine 2-epimerase [Alcaligenaceae bacterium SJ-26]|nr:UDP-N-acetyl glucosamine 2-epimerase [Alcaligenaceae bacterium SJ-26]